MICPGNELELGLICKYLRQFIVGWEVLSSQFINCNVKINWIWKQAKMNGWKMGTQSHSYHRFTYKTLLNFPYSPSFAF